MSSTPKFGFILEYVTDVEAARRFYVEALDRGGCDFDRGRRGRFAAAVALAARYTGLEIASVASLIDAGIDYGTAPSPTKTLAPEMISQIETLAHKIHTTLAEQSADWKRRSIFEQQWLIRSFKQQAGRPVEQWLELLTRVEDLARQGDGAGVLALDAPLNLLARYYGQLADMAKGYIKDPAQREEQLGIVHGWQAECEQLNNLLMKSYNDEQ